MRWSRRHEASDATGGLTPWVSTQPLLVCPLSALHAPTVPVP